MNGFEATAFVETAGAGDYLYYSPVSRVLAGGFSNTRPALVAVLGVDLEWDSEDWIGWDDDTDIAWEV